MSISMAELFTGLASPGQVCRQLADQFWGWRRLFEPRRGRPIVYADLTIWLAAVIQLLWQKSNEGIIRYLYHHLDLAVALGYPVDLEQPAFWGEEMNPMSLNNKIATIRNVLNPDKLTHIRQQYLHDNQLERSASKRQLRT